MILYVINQCHLEKYRLNIKNDNFKSNYKEITEYNGVYAKKKRFT